MTEFSFVGELVKYKLLFCQIWMKECAALCGNIIFKGGMNACLTLMLTMMDDGRKCCITIKSGCITLCKGWR